MSTTESLGQPQQWPFWTQTLLNSSLPYLPSQPGPQEHISGLFPQTRIPSALLLRSGLHKPGAAYSQQTPSETGDILYLHHTTQKISQPWQHIVPPIGIRPPTHPHWRGGGWASPQCRLQSAPSLARTGAGKEIRKQRTRRPSSGEDTPEVWRW